MFGLIFVITFSCVITALDVGLLKFLIFLSRFRTALAPRIDRWIQDSNFQLQRRVYEAHGRKNWNNTNADIPLTIDNDLPDLVSGNMIIASTFDLESACICSELAAKRKKSGGASPSIIRTREIPTESLDYASTRWPRGPEGIRPRYRRNHSV